MLISKRESFPHFVHRKHDYREIDCLAGVVGDRKFSLDAFALDARRLFPLDGKRSDDLDYKNPLNLFRRRGRVRQPQCEFGLTGAAGDERARRELEELS